MYLSRNLETPVTIIYLTFHHFPKFSSAPSKPSAPYPPVPRPVTDPPWDTCIFLGMPDCRQSKVLFSMGMGGWKHFYTYT